MESSRRTATVTISAAGRDHGKVFFITEKSSYDAEQWANRLVLALTENGVDVPEDVILNPSMAGIASVGLKAIGRVKAPVVLELMNEMMGCIEIYPDPQSRQFKRAILEGAEGDIAEVATRYFLRGEVLSLHLGFSIADAIMKQISAAKTAREAQRGSRATQTSRRRSRQ